MVMTGGLVSNCTFRASWDRGNWAGCGGVVMSGGLMVDCLIEDNEGGSSSFEVGGLRLSGGDVWNTIIRNNIYGTAASGTAGGVGLSGSGRLVNTLVTANDGIGIAQSGGSIVNSTVVRNSLAGINQTDGSVTNTIIYFNNQGGDNLIGGGTHYRYSCAPELEDVFGDTGNINLDPMFEDPGSGYGTTAVHGNYILSRRSPCIETGVFLDWLVGTTDLAGGPRILDNVPDIGAYETEKPIAGTLFMVR